MGIPESSVQKSDTLSTFGLDNAATWPQFWSLLRRSLLEAGYELPPEAIGAPPECTLFKLPDLIVDLTGSIDRLFSEDEARSAIRLRWHFVHIPKPESGIGVQIFYASDRAYRKTPCREADLYGSGRSGQGLRFGTCLVTIPLRHRTGVLERPSIFRLELHPDSERHVILKEIQEKEHDTYFQTVAQCVAQSASKQAFVFIHGYNVTFEEAACRTAQLAYDLNFDGAPILYSWPSHGALVAYSWDEANVEWRVPHLRAFLVDLATLTGARIVHLIAHSMGRRFHHAILAAPDIDAEVFRAMADAIIKAAARVTLYFSPHDRALRASKIFHGYARAGVGAFVLPGIDIIDASAVDTSLLGHSYVATNRSVLSDIFQLVSSNAEPSKRFGMRMLHSPLGTYYAFQP